LVRISGSKGSPPSLKIGNPLEVERANVITEDGFSSAITIRLAPLGISTTS
jgi:hypothetical protein